MTLFIWKYIIIDFSCNYYTLLYGNKMEFIDSQNQCGGSIYISNLYVSDDYQLVSKFSAVPLSLEEILHRLNIPTLATLNQAGNMNSACPVGHCGLDPQSSGFSKATVRSHCEGFKQSPGPQLKRIGRALATNTAFVNTLFSSSLFTTQPAWCQHRQYTHIPWMPAYAGMTIVK